MSTKIIATILSLILTLVSSTSVNAKTNLELLKDPNNEFDVPPYTKKDVLKKIVEDKITTTKSKAGDAPIWYPPAFKSLDNARTWIKSLKKVADQPSAVDHLSTLKQEHPRLLISKTDIEQIRKQIKNNPLASQIHKALNKRAEDILLLPLVNFNRGIDGNYLETSRLVLKRVSLLAGLFLIDNEEKYFNRARKEMLAAADLPNWHPEHFLDVAEMTAALSIGYDWLYDKLTEPERNKIKTAIVELGLKPGLTQYANHIWWTYSQFNWNLVSNGGLIIGALAVGDDEPEIANKIISCAKMSAPIAMSSFSPDGGWAEGPGYWCYATKYAMIMLASLKSALNNDFGWIKNPGFSKTGFFRIHYTSPTKQYFNFADSKSTERKAPQMFWLSREFKEPVFAGAEVETAKKHPDIFHLLFFDDKQISPEDMQLSKSRLFKSINVGFYRSSWSNPQALYIGFKGGSNLVNHCHLDLGSYIVDWLGKRFVCELGPDNYSLPGYFGKSRWNYYRLASEGQNTITIDNKNQFKEANATINQFKKNRDKFVATIDLSEAYKKKALSVLRTFAVVNEKGSAKELVIVDDLKLSSKVSITSHIHTKAAVSISKNGKEVRLKKGNKKIVIALTCPESAHISIVPVKLAKPQFNSPDLKDIQIKIPAISGKVSIVVRFKKAS